MKQYTVTKIKETNVSSFVLKQANIPKVHERLMVIMGSDEVIFCTTYMSAIMQNKRIGKFLKNSLNFSNESN